FTSTRSLSRAETATASPFLTASSNRGSPVLALRVPNQRIRAMGQPNNRQRMLSSTFVRACPTGINLACERKRLFSARAAPTNVHSRLLAAPSRRDWAYGSVGEKEGHRHHHLTHGVNLTLASQGIREPPALALFDRDGCCSTSLRMSTTNRRSRQEKSER